MTIMTSIPAGTRARIRPSYSGKTGKAKSEAGLFWRKPVAAPAVSRWSK
jgi:hypothetical protein